MQSFIQRVFPTNKRRTQYCLNLKDNRYFHGREREGRRKTSSTRSDHNKMSARATKSLQLFCSQFLFGDQALNELRSILLVGLDPFV
jgi:hypothetical protein